MILAAAACADRKGQPPPELDLAFDNQAFGGLPVAGGHLDQPAGLLRRMRTARNVFHAWRAYQLGGHQAGEFVKWRVEHPDQAEIVDLVKLLRKKHVG